MQTIKILSALAINGQHQAVGTIVNASDIDARYLCAIGKAELHDGEPTEAVISEEVLDELIGDQAGVAESRTQDPVVGKSRHVKVKE